MILVLGRPGAGCSTLLRVLANDRKHYKEVLGEVTYNSLSAETVAKHYKGEVLYNQEGKIPSQSIVREKNKRRKEASMLSTTRKKNTQ